MQRVSGKETKEKIRIGEESWRGKAEKRQVNEGQVWGSEESRER